MINLKQKIFVAGHNSLVGSTILRKLKDNGYKKIPTVKKSQLDLTGQKKVLQFLKKYKSDSIFIAAVKVEEIYSHNKYPAEFIQINLSIQTNISHSAYLAGVRDLILFSSSCVYPRMCKQPIKEKYLLSSQLEKTNKAYAIAKVAGIKMCESFNIQFNKIISA